MHDVRWRQRYSNYTNILKLLGDNLSDKSPEEFNELEQIGLAKSYELCFELLWKLLKDYLEYEDIEIGLVSPKNILKAAAEKGLLEDMEVNGDILIMAHKSRNELVHVYDHEKFNQILKQIKELYLPEMIRINHYFKVLCENGK
ncbi:MAG: nucleotidyltransferase substrate binding protein [Defluviitaleaceae bacterium]|nr:nucleotidyltransferase substrate binding protein [Defluviitaleaceae bacterium]